jgi:hypothetical protein
MLESPTHTSPKGCPEQVGSLEKYETLMQVHERSHGATHHEHTQLVGHDYIALIFVYLDPMRTNSRAPDYIVDRIAFRRPVPLNVHM